MFCIARVSQRTPRSISRCTRHLATAAASRPSEPLRILFCGSDAFSCASLKALHAEHKENSSLIESLDVMVLPGKRTGRGLKVVSEVPCKILAEELGLPVHQRPTFRGWDLPSGTNLVVAVSFGLFVPPRILSSATYGGLNVHPSLLPDLRGPAPVHHALLNGDTHTGVSLQTLDEVAFDHGSVLAQTPPLPIPRDANLTSLTAKLADVGAAMLVQGLRDGVYVPPHEDVSKGSAERHAPKVHKDEAQVRWDAWTGDEWRRRRSVFGSVWTMGTLTGREGQGGKKRVIFTDFGVVRSADGMDAMRIVPLGVAGGVQARLDERAGDCYVPLKDGCWARVGKVIVDGKPEQVAAVGLRPFFGDA